MVDEDSQEEKDLKLLEKELRSHMPGNYEALSKEDMDKIRDIKESGLSEYQEKSLSILESEIPYVTAVYEAKQEIGMENRIISTTKIERLKSHSMIDAQKEAELIMKEAALEIKGMLVDEAKNNIDENADEQKEKAKLEAEKQKEIQERIDAAKEKKTKNELVTENIIENVEEISSKVNDVGEALQEIKNMMNKMKLVEEDIKGVAVDKNL